MPFSPSFEVGRRASPIWRAPSTCRYPAISKHIRVLEKAGLVRREVSGREHTCWFQPDALADAERWLTHYRAFWESTLDALVDYVEEKT